MNMNEAQVRNILKFIDASQSEETKNAIFSQLGSECFYSHHQDQALEKYKGDVQSFLDIINVQQKSDYWESLVFSEDRKTLTLTGRVVERCACAFADCSQPPLSLCNYCCKAFQQEYFKALFGRDVDVKITSAFLWGDERCSTIIYFP
jgi:hypothetical protein